MTDQPKRRSSDRVPLDRKLTILVAQGRWREINDIGKTHGWTSPEMVRFADTNLPSSDCPTCGQQFCQTSKRMKYCSDDCRRVSANERDRLRERAKASADGLPPYRQAALAARHEYCVRLERDDVEETRRWCYIVMLVQTLFGKHALIRRWSRKGTERWQSAQKEFDTNSAALDEMNIVVAACLKKGYALLPTEENLHAARVLKPGRVPGAPTGGTATTSSSPVPVASPASTRGQTVE